MTSPPPHWYHRNAGGLYTLIAVVVVIAALILFVVVPDNGLAAYLALCIGSVVLAVTVGQMIKKDAVTNGELTQVLLGLVATGLGGVSSARKAFDEADLLVAIGAPAIVIAIAGVVGYVGYKSVE